MDIPTGCLLLCALAWLPAQEPESGSFLDKAPAQASVIAWDTTRITRASPPDQNHADATFGFTYVGSGTLRLTRIDTFCGCTTATFPQEELSTSSHGTVAMTFDFGHYTGMTNKTVIVHYVHGAERTIGLQELHLEIDIPRIFGSGSETAGWSLAEYRDVAARHGAKSVNLTFARDDGQHVTGASTRSERFALAWTALPDGVQLNLTPLMPDLVPASGTNPLMDKIDVEVRYPNGVTRTHGLWSLIRP